MKINKDTWHYKLWLKSFSDKWEVPRETDLCRYCHRVFWKLAGIALLGTMVVVTIGMAIALLVIIAYQGFWLHTGTFMKVVGAAVLAITLIVLYVRWLKEKRHRPEPKTLVGKYARASKQKVCPLVQFTSDEDDRPEDTDENW